MNVAEGVGNTSFFISNEAQRNCVKKVGYSLGGVNTLITAFALAKREQNNKTPSAARPLKTIALVSLMDVLAVPLVLKPLNQLFCIGR